MTQGTSQTRNWSAAITEDLDKQLWPVVAVASDFVVKGEDGSVDLNKTRFVVKGTVMRYNANPAIQALQPLDLDRRWLTLTAAEVAKAYEVAKALGQIERGRVLSSVAGNRFGIGSEPALGLCLDVPGTIPAGMDEKAFKAVTEEAEKLAKSFGINYVQTAVVGQIGNTREVQTSCMLLVTLEAIQIAVHKQLFPEIVREDARPSMMDPNNPSLQQGLAHFDATGQLPQRQEVGRRVINTSFAAAFQQANPQPQRRGNYRNGYGNNSQPANAFVGAPSEDYV